MSFQLQGKCALVTGGTGALGGAIARTLTRAGATVFVASRADASHAADVAAWLRADLSTEEGCEELAGALRERTPRLQILVNNAGTSWGADFERFPAKGWDKVVDLNLKAPFYLTRALLSCLEASASREDPARVINIGSVDGARWMGLPNFSYAAAKAGLHHLTTVLARELGPRSIAVNTVAPGPIESKLTAETLEVHRDDFVARTPLGRLGTPEDVASAVLYLASPAGAFVSGVVLPVDGGYLSERIL